MALILSEPMKQGRSGNSEILAKFPFKTQKFIQNALAGSAHRPGEKGEKNHKKNISPVFSQKKLFF
jgi:hypothetical protein